MKRIAMTMGFFGVFLILFSLPSAFAQVSSTGWEPFTDTFFNCATGEEISITGMDQWVEKERWDASGGYHVLSIYMARGYGIGVSSGSGYRFNYRQPIELINEAQGGEHTLILNGVLIALDKNVPDLRITIITHLTYDANGNLRSDVYFENFNCTEP